MIHPKNAPETPPSFDAVSDRVMVILCKEIPLGKSAFKLIILRFRGLRIWLLQFGVLRLGFVSIDREYSATLYCSRSTASLY